MKLIVSFQFCVKETFPLVVITIHSHKNTSQRNSSFVVNVHTYPKRYMMCLFAIHNASFEILNTAILLISTMHSANIARYNLILLCLKLVKNIVVSSTIN